MKNTFGKNPASVRLDQLLAENPSARRKVSSLLSEYTNQLLLIVDIKDSKAVRLCMDLLRNHTLERVDRKVNLSAEIKTYTKNVVIGRYRSFRRGYEEVNKAAQWLKQKP